MLVCRLAPEGMRRAERRLRRLAHVPTDVLQHELDRTLRVFCISSRQPLL